jgi:hypothetical protein
MWNHVQQQIDNETTVVGEDSIFYPDPIHPNSQHEPTIQDLQLHAQIFEKRAKNTKEHYKKLAWKERKDKLAEGGKAFYKYLKKDYRTGVTVIEGEDGQPTTHLPTIHRIFEDFWKGVYNTHKHTKPDFDKFEDEYGDCFPRTPAPKGPPDASQLHTQAKRASFDSAQSTQLPALQFESLGVLPSFIHTMVGDTIWQTCWQDRHAEISGKHWIPYKLLNITKTVVENKYQLEDGLLEEGRKKYAEVEKAAAKRRKTTAPH